MSCPSPESWGRREKGQHAGTSPDGRPRSSCDLVPVRSYSFRISCTPAVAGTEGVADDVTEEDGGAEGGVDGGAEGGVDGGAEGGDEDELLDEGELLGEGELLSEDIDVGGNPDDDAVFGSVKKSEGTDPVDPGAVGMRSGAGEGAGAAAGGKADGRVEPLDPVGPNSR